MPNTIANKPAKKTQASAAAPKGTSIVKPPTDGVKVSGTASMKKVLLLNGPDRSRKPLVDAAVVPAEPAVTTAVETTNAAGTSPEQEKLSPAESSRFAELHKLVRNGLKKMNQLRLQVAAALLEIRDKKLYRDAYKSYEAFCIAELNLLKAHAYALAKAGEVYRDLESAMADKSKLPANERQMRPLTRLKSATQRVKAWARAREFAKDGKTTEAHVRKAVKEIQPKATKTALPPPQSKPDNVWHAQMVTKFIAEGFELASQQPITWPSDAASMHSPTADRYVKFIESLDLAEAACVVALWQISSPCLVVINASANAPKGVLFSKGQQPLIEKESFPWVFHIIAKALDAVLEIDGMFYKAGELDESFRTGWTPVSYKDLELPEPPDDSNDEQEAGDQQ